MKILLTFVFSLGIANQLASCQRSVGACSYSVSETQTSYRVTQESYRTSYRCGWWRRCKRTKYRQHTVSSSRVVYHTETRCCNGYTGEGIQCSPICNDCTDGRVCMEPGKCVCSAGWTGENCSDDVNECLSTDTCEYNCTNTHGSYNCTCEDGRVLASDQSSCIDSPQNTTLIAISSTSLNLTWELPHMNGIITQFLISCSSAKRIGEGWNRTSSQTRYLHLNALSPYTTYTCCVTANTTGGLSNPACETQTTLEEVPSDSPVNVTVAAVSPFAVEIEWRPPTTPNGVIVNYTVYANNIAIVEWSFTRYLYQGLSPYEEVSISVSASTKIGEGPRSIEVTIRTLESVPGVVDSLEVVALSANLLQISWEPPLSPNGVLTGYLVEVANFTSTEQSLVEQIIHIADREELSVNLSRVSGEAIKPYIPYIVSVSAITSIGTGDSVEVIVFTKEGVPLKGPSEVSVNRTEATVAVVMWEPLSIEHLRGNLSSYEIVYYEMLSNDECQQDLTDNVKTMSAHQLEREALFPITDLDPGLQYCVGVAAKTNAGVGVFTYTVIPWHTNTVFTLALVGIDRCTQWRLNMISERAIEIAHEISKGIELICSCNLSSDYITDEKFTCENEHLMIFHGRIISTNDRDSSDLAGDLEEWVSTKPTIVVQGKELQVISSDHDMEQEDSQLSGTVVGAVVPVIILLLLISAVTVVSGMILFRRRIKRSYTSHKISRSTTNPAGHESEDSGEVLREFSNTLYYTNHHISRKSPTTNCQMNEVQVQVLPPEYLYNPTGSHPVPQNRTTHTATPYAETVISHEEPNAGDTTSAEGVYSEVTAGREVNVYDVPR